MIHPLKYLPFLTGTYSVAPGLLPIARAEKEIDQHIFQVDDQYEKYLDNKTICRKENIRKYYLEHHLHSKTNHYVVDYIASQLQKEYPSLFEYNKSNLTCQFLNYQTKELLEWDKKTLFVKTGKYVSVLDALCSQVQEDVAVCQLKDDKDWIAAVHLCSPNHWSPAEKIGQTFDVVHAPVAGMQKTFPHYFKMLQSIVSKEPFTRFAWGIATDTRLNHHPEPPTEADAKEWTGRQISTDTALYIRTERQNLVGFLGINAFLFTIRTYFYDVATLENEEKKQLWAAVQSMSPESLAYKGLTGITDVLLKKLFEE